MLANIAQSAITKRVRLGFANWCAILCKLRASKDVGGIEWLVVLLVHFLHITTVSGLIKIVCDPVDTIEDNAEKKSQQLSRRNRYIEAYVIIQFFALIVLLAIPQRVGVGSCLLASYFLYEMLLNLFSIVFVGKLEGIYPKTPSIERSLLLFGINVLQVIVIYAIYYRGSFNFDPLVAVVHSALVFGTIGHPLGKELDGGIIVVTQIIVDFVLLAVFLSAFVGNLRAFRRTN
jgi:hypothetical protein